MNTTSYWIDSASLPSFPTLDQDLDVDVAIVGGGITGITAAYLFKQAGQRVALLDRAQFAAVDTGHTTAHLTCVTDLRLQSMARIFGRDHTKAVWDAGAAAMDQILTLIRHEDIACDFHWVPGFLHAPLAIESDRTRDIKRLRREAKLARELGIAAEYVTGIRLLEAPAVRFPRQAIFHPRKYLAALLKTIPGDGSQVFESSAVDRIAEDPLTVHVGAHRIRCRYVVLATHTPLSGATGFLKALLFQTKLYLYTSYALGARVLSGLIPEGCYWDTGDPYDYIRVEPREGHDYVIYGGEDHKTGQEGDTGAAFARLEHRLRKLVPAAEVTHRWSGQVIETNDGLPFIGETAPHQFAATGFSGNGMTFGTLGAMMAVDAMLGRKNPWQDLFAPNRRTVRGGTLDYLRENKDYPFYLVRDWLGGSEGESVDAVARGEGRILQLEGKKVAAYRDETGKLSLCSPVCTHLQCIVAWNSAERTWDCPCHGSRFQPTGEVISGPAEEPLAKVKLRVTART
jgi:glycine/D-amino acid oxidase-like deaminating enzyme/nitrite reductase/ring-hydroxylating ferredoxin subunit